MSFLFRFVPNIRKKIFKAFRVGLLFGGLGVSFVAVGQVTGQLQVDGPHFKDASGNIVVLRGISLIGVQNLKTERKGAEFIINLLTDSSRGWHAKMLRLPVFPGQYFANPARYVQNHLQPTVDLCVAKKLYCIIDWHYIDSPYKRLGETKSFWADMAARYKDNPYILFEIFNEPVTAASGSQAEWDKWKGFAQEIVDLIRQTARKNIILVGGPHYSQHMRGAVSNPVTGKNIAYVAHIYPGGYYPLANKRSGNSADYWEYNAGVVADQFPVVVTEWGFGSDAYNETKGELATFGLPFKAWAESRNLSWTSWVADYAWYPVMFKRDYSPTEFGKFVREWLEQGS
ncbi:MAG: glycoside hydrolase family 5 protein [Burkholderiales bacterium]|nr:glycoside hydrolase family 5 protein [Burkholderiales bacterium]